MRAGLDTLPREPHFTRRRLEKAFPRLVWGTPLANLSAVPLRLGEPRRATEAAMKRAVLWSLTLFVALCLPGCPIYPDDQGCFSDSDCGRGYVCDYPSGLCVQTQTTPECQRPEDCQANYTCGSDQQCHPGSCYFHGCAPGYVCQDDQGVRRCVRNGTGNLDAGAAPDAPTPRDAGINDDASSFDSSVRDSGNAPEAASDAAPRDAHPAD